MKLGIMQPYFFPYIGYWQLLNAVDKYVIYDDVNFIKGGWINRNRILLNGQAQFVNVQMEGASPNVLINEVGRNINPAIINKELRRIEAAYKKAPYFDNVYSLISGIMMSQETNLSKFLTYSICEVCKYLDIKTDIIVSSAIEKSDGLKAEKRVLDICERLGATEYYNAIGGQELYSKEEFGERGIELNFLKTELKEYTQFGGEFLPGLSIIDVMMFCDAKEVQEMLTNYTLI